MVYKRESARANGGIIATAATACHLLMKNTPVWKDASRCVGNLTQSQTGTLIDPRISEEGRQFLARLLTQLTDRQLRDLFTVARFPTRTEADDHPTTVDEWVDAFKQKRQEIVSAHCPA